MRRCSLQCCRAETQQSLGFVGGEKRARREPSHCAGPDGLGLGMGAGLLTGTIVRPRRMKIKGIVMLWLSVDFWPFAEIEMLQDGRFGETTLL